MLVNSAHHIHSSFVEKTQHITDSVDIQPCCFLSLFQSTEESSIEQKDVFDVSKYDSKSFLVQ